MVEGIKGVDFASLLNASTFGAHVSHTTRKDLNFVIGLTRLKPSRGLSLLHPQHHCSTAIEVRRDRCAGENIDRHDAPNEALVVPRCHAQSGPARPHVFR